MTRRRVSFFRYAPDPVEDETLGSWVHRVASGQDRCGSGLISLPEVDWAPDASLLAFLARGSGRSPEELRAMTLDRRFPGSVRADFARSAGPIFPGCHAFCPLCGGRDVAMYGHVILRARNAGLWRLACSEHRCLLDSIEDEGEITPPRNGRECVWRDGRIRPGRRPAAAPPVALAFERAIERAGQQRDPGPLWLERDPDRFRSAAITLTNWVLVLRRGGIGDAPSPAWALLGGRMPRLWGRGVNAFDEDLLHRLPTWLRARAVTACARLLLRPPATGRLGEEVWWVPSGAQRDHFGEPWTVATAVVGRAQLETIWEASAAWSAPLRTAIRKVVARRLAAICAFRR